MVEVCHKIRDNFQLYTQLIEKSKMMKSPSIVLENGPNKKWEIKWEPLFHDSVEEIDLNIAKRKNDIKYGIRIFVKQLHDNPIYYFDSDGPSHDNRDGDTKLVDTKVKTPHINYYDEKGIKKAKRDNFIDSNESILQLDINVGMKYFCGEVNINKNRVVPPIVPESGVIPLFNNLETDVHKNVNFFDEN